MNEFFKGTMSTRIGLIQTRGIGDIIIALPIADYYFQRGCEVFWPIDEAFLPIFRSVKPEVNFIGISGMEGADYFLGCPQEQLRERKCDPIFILYSYLSNTKACDESLFRSLKFDEYKYAIADVPFSHKWKLALKRDSQRELALHNKLGISKPYICVHKKVADITVNLTLPQEWREKYQIIEVEPITDSPFDWIHTLEHAQKLVLVDSCFANLVEQLNLKGEKYLILRSPVQFTPVMKNGWRFLPGLTK